jgi:hypothetical protein
MQILVEAVLPCEILELGHQRAMFTEPEPGVDERGECIGSEAFDAPRLGVNQAMPPRSASGRERQSASADRNVATRSWGDSARAACAMSRSAVRDRWRRLRDRVGSLAVPR